MDIPEASPDPGSADRSRASLGRRSAAAAGSQADAMHCAAAFSEAYRQAVAAVPWRHCGHHGADRRFRSSWCFRTRRAGCRPDLVPRWAHRFTEPAAADAAKHKSWCSETTRFSVTRRTVCPVDLSVQDLAASHDPLAPTVAERARDRLPIRQAVTAIWRPGRDRPIQQAGDACRADLAAESCCSVPTRSTAAPGRLPYSQSW